MARLLIPTRNRPTSLLSVVRFLERFSPQASVIVADGSNDAFATENEANMTSADRTIAVEYRRYPYELGFFDRILDVLEGISDPHIIMASDDDYPLLDTLAKAEEALIADPSAVTAMGATVNLRLDAPDELYSMLNAVRPIRQDDPLKRMRAFAAWSYSTTYAVSRRDLLIARYRRARELFLVGFYDFGVGLQECSHGKIIGVPDIGFIATRNFNHSYLRTNSRLLFLRRVEDIFTMRRNCAADLEQYAQMAPVQAERAADHLVRRRIAEHAGYPAPTREGFEHSPLFRNNVVRQQFSVFRDIFRPGTSVRQRFQERLEAIGEALRSASTSKDNSGEPQKFQTLDGQRDGSTLPTSAPAEPPKARTTKIQRTALYNPARMNERLDPQTLTLLGDPLSTLSLLLVGSERLSPPAGADLTSGGAPVTPAEAGLWPRVSALLEARGQGRDVTISAEISNGRLGVWGRGGAHFIALREGVPRLSAEVVPPRFCILDIDAVQPPQVTPQAYRERVGDLLRLLTRLIPEMTFLICRSGRAERPDLSAAQDGIIREHVNCLAGPILDYAGDEAGLAELMTDAISFAMRPASLRQSA
ncbi:MAG: TIGR00180 family glycosyltransferase [Pseudomonadota bacterium]